MCSTVCVRLYAFDSFLSIVCVRQFPFDCMRSAVLACFVFKIGVGDLILILWKFYSINVRTLSFGGVPMAPKASTRKDKDECFFHDFVVVVLSPLFRGGMYYLRVTL